MATRRDADLLLIAVVTATILPTAFHSRRGTQTTSSVRAFAGKVPMLNAVVAAVIVGATLRVYTKIYDAIPADAGNSQLDGGRTMTLTSRRRY